MKSSKYDLEGISNRGIPAPAQFFNPLSSTIQTCKWLVWMGLLVVGAGGWSMLQVFLAVTRQLNRNGCDQQIVTK